jgi:hypothetical protein
LQRGADIHDAKLLTFHPDQTDLGGIDFFIDALRLLLGDGFLLQKLKNQAAWPLLCFSRSRRSIKASGNICPRS